jgi:hypothetical protein
MVYSRSFGRLAQWESAAFTRQRSLVRTQHRPLGKTAVLQGKTRNTDERPEYLSYSCAATVQQREGSSARLTFVQLCDLQVSGLACVRGP